MKTKGSSCTEHLIWKLPFERLFLVETSSFGPIRFCFLSNLKKCKYFNCEYINIYFFVLDDVLQRYSSETCWCVRVRVYKRQRRNSTELEAVISACVKLYFLFWVVNSMKTCLQCGDTEHYDAESARGKGGFTSSPLVYLLHHQVYRERKKNHEK